MAVTAREVIMVFRGQNYLSSAIRRVGRDVSTLSRPQQLAAQTRQLQITRQRLLLSRNAAAAEVQSIQIGARSLAQEKAKAEQKVAQMRADATLLRNQAQLGRATRAVQTGRPLRGFNMAETIQQQKALQLQVAAATSAIENQEIAVRQLIARETQLAEREAQLQQTVLNRTRGIQLYNDKLRDLRQQILNLPWERFQTGARYVEHAGRVLQMFGLIAGAALGYFADQSAKFNTQITLAATQSTTATNNTTRQVLRNAGQLQEAVMKLLAAGKTAAAPSELTNALYTIFSGITLRGNQQAQLRQGVAILEQFNRVYTANFGQVQFNDIVKAGVALINNFGLSAKSLPSVLNRMQASVRFGAMTLSEFTGSLNQVVPAFRGAHFGFDQMAADIAFVSRLFPSLRVGTTGLARLTEMFARAKVRGGIQQQLGINIAPQGRLLPLNQIVDEIVKARPELAKGSVDLQDFFKTVSGTEGTVQARRVFVGFATNAKLYHTIARQVLGDNNELTKSFTDMSQTPQVRWAEFTNQLRELVLEIGAGAIPAFQAIAGPIKAAVEWFNQLTPSTQKAIGYFTTFVAVGALVGGTLMAIVGGIASLVAGFVLMSRGKAGLLGFARDATTAKGALGLLRGEAGFISVGGLLSLGIPLAIPLLIHYHRQVGEVVDKLGGIGNTVQIAFAGIAAVKFTSLVLGLKSIELAEIGAAGWAGKLQAALLGLSGSGALGVLAKLAPALGLAMGAELPAIPDIIKQLQGKDPFGQPSAQALGITTAAHKLIYGINNQFSDAMGRDINKPNNIAKQFGFNTASNVIDAFLSKKISPKEFNEFTKQFFGPQFGRQTRIATDFGITKTDFEKPAKTIDEATKKIQQAGLGYLTGLAKFKKQASDATHTVVKGATVTPVAPPTRTVQQWISLIEDARKKMLGAPKDIQAAQHYEQVVSALNKAYKDQPNLLAAINDVLGAYDSATKKATSSTQELGVTTQDVLQSMTAMYNNFLQQEQSAFGTLFQGPFVNAPATQDRLQFGGQLTGQDLVKDLKSQLTQFRQFHGQLDELSRRGAPRELITQLAALGPAALKQIESLNHLSPSALRGYFKLFQESQRAIHQQTMRDLNQQLAQYRKYGRNIALQIVAGLRDENVHLTNYLQKLITKMFPGLPTGATGAGGRPTHRAPGGTTTHNHNTTYNVTAPKSEHASVKAQLRHADFVARQRAQRRGK